MPEITIKPPEPTTTPVNNNLSGINQEPGYLSVDDAPPIQSNNTDTYEGNNPGALSYAPGTIPPAAATETIPGIEKTNINVTTMFNTDLIDSGNTIKPQTDNLIDNNRVVPTTPGVGKDFDPSYTAPGIDPTKTTQISVTSTTTGNIVKPKTSTFAKNLIDGIINKAINAKLGDPDSEEEETSIVADAFSGKNFAQDKIFNNKTKKTDKTNKATGSSNIEGIGEGVSVVGEGVAQDATRKALSYLGISEGTGGQAQFTQNKWHQGGYNEHWCADFVSTVYNQVTGGNSPFGFQAGCSSIVNWAQTNGKYNQSRNPGTVKPGDLILFGAGGGSHVGIVASVEGDIIHTVEGNYSNKVSAVNRNIRDSYVHGFVSMS
ncbi:MAG: hypothetical protein A2X42_01120 [Candidatus Margulisbacteria bacterium GWF2_38_17]|nr:MAG: hypothetical protein A2X42_01120 [Candidatus Margulisbacteria bacterium GWF2_38_17]